MNSPEIPSRFSAADDPARYYEAAQAYLAQGWRLAALIALAEILRIDPRHALGRRLLSEIYAEDNTLARLAPATVLPPPGPEQSVNNHDDILLRASESAAMARSTR